MDCFVKNISAFKKINTSLARDLDECAESQENIRVLQSPLGHYVMYKKNISGWYMQLNSMYDPHEEASYICKKLPNDLARRVIVVIGVGMGYHLKEVFNRVNDKSQVIIVEEDINVLKSFLKYQDFSKEIESGKVFFSCGNTEQVVAKVKKAVTSLTFNLNDVTIITLPVMDMDYLKYCRTISESIDVQRTNHIFNMGNDTEDTLIGIRNNFLNCNELLNCIGIKEFLDLAQDKYKNKPAVIVASGPSLNKNIHLLKDIQDKVLIIACDGSLKPLLDNEIEPHIVSSIERVWKTYEAFYKDKQIPEKTVLLAPPIIRKEIFQRFNNNRKILSLKSWEGIHEWIAQAIPHKGTLPTGTSVAHLCFNFARAVGANPIIFIGQDLAYSSDGYTHAEGVEIRELKDVDNDTIYVKDYEGKDIPSTYVWRNFLTQFELFISQTDLLCIDATEGGAYIKGTKIMKLQDVIKEYCNFEEDIYPIHRIVEEYKPDINIVQKDYKKLIILIEKQIEEFEELIKNANIALKNSGQLVKKINIKRFRNSDVDKLYDTIDWVENEIVQKIITQWVFMMAYQTPLRIISVKISSLGKGIQEVTPQVLLENIKLQRELVEQISSIGNQFIDTFLEVKQITESYLYEN